MDVQTVSINSTGDRLSSLLFVAVLLHGVVILGVSFSAVVNDDQSISPTLEVVLVSEDLADDSPPEDADYLAQRNMRGSGLDEEQTRSARLAPSGAPIEIDGFEQGNHVLDTVLLEQNPTPDRISTRAESDDIASSDTQSEIFAATEPLVAQRLVANTDFLVPNDEFRQEREILQRDDRDYFVSVSTRETDVAEYLASWKSRVEKLGTTRFPELAKSPDFTGFPILEVAINSDGTLHEIVVRKSSGHKPLDQAALDIVQYASPFAPFPAELKVRYDVLRFAYEWHFLDGTAGTATVKVSADTDPS